MARFQSGLNHKIAGVVELQHYVELEDMVHMAIMEREQNEKSDFSQPSPSSSLWKLSWSKDEKVAPKNKNRTTQKVGKWQAKWEVNLKFKLVFVILNAFDVWEQGTYLHNVRIKGL